MMNRQERRAAESEGRRLTKKGWSPWEAMTLPDPEKYPTLRNVFEVWKNNCYIVQVALEKTEWGAVRRLMIRRNDGEPTRSWADMQRIKNDLCGPEEVGLEVFPRESELVDDANIYHLWVLGPCMDLPFNLKRKS